MTSAPFYTEKMGSKYGVHTCVKMKYCEVTFTLYWQRIYRREVTRSDLKSLLKQPFEK